MRDPFPQAPSQFVQIIKPISDWSGLSTLPLHLHEIAAACLWYQFLFKIASPVVSRLLAPGTYDHLPKRTRINWDVHFVSSIQSLFIVTCALYVSTSDIERTRMRWEQRLWGYTGAGGMVQAFAAGYFLWDLLVSIIHLDILGQSSLLHAVGALLVTSIGFRPFANFYGLNFILYELSTPFLNIHWFLDKLQMTGSRAQLYNGIMLLLTFGCSRLVWGVYQSILIYQDIWTALKSPVTSTAGQPLGSLPKSDSTGLNPMEQEYEHSLPVWLIVLYLGGNTVLTVLNFYWYKKMISAVLKRFQPKDPKGGTVKKD